MKKLLLLIPFFMDYQLKLSSVLASYYCVTLVNSDLFDKPIIDQYCSCSKIRWAMRHVLRKVKYKDLEDVQNLFLKEFSKSISLEKKAYDIVLCINGGYLPDKLYERLKENNTTARFIYYAWDDLANLMKTSHIRFFDNKYSFNIFDCKSNGMNYVPMFVQEEAEGHADTDVYDVAFIASAHSGRAEIAEKLYSKYKNKLKMLIYLYDSEMATGSQFAHNKPLKNEDYINIMRCSKAIVDIPHEKQKGPTTRAFDALLTKTKVITTNKFLMDYPVWSNNIQYTDISNIEIDKEFLEREYEETGYKALSIKDWVGKIGL